MFAEIRRRGVEGLLAATGVGLVSMAALTDIGHANADNQDVGLVLGGSGTPIPGADYVHAADTLYLEHVYPNEITSFYGATADNPLGLGVFTPEGLYPLTGVHTLPLNYPAGGDLGLPTESTSAGQGITILANTIESEIAQANTATVLGYSQSSTITGLTMDKLKADGVSPDAVKFVLLGDPSNPNGGLLERFAGFETTTGHLQPLELSLPSLGVSFDGATPADDYLTSMYSLEYDGFTDFPRYPLNGLADLNAFLGIALIHTTYLHGGIDGSGPTAEQIAHATLLPGSAALGAADSMTNYYMIDQTAPLVALLPAPLQALLGPDLTYLINLGYGDGSEGYSVTADAPANIATPFGLFPDISMTDVMTNLATKTQEGITAFQTYLTDPASLTATLEPVSNGANVTDLFTHLAADPSATLTELINAVSTATSSAYSALLPTADIANALVTSLPAYDLSLFTDNLTNGDLIDAIGLPAAATTALTTLATGFEAAVLAEAATTISAAFTGLF